MLYSDQGPEASAQGKGCTIVLHFLSVLVNSLILLYPMKISEKDRVELIRKGNQLFNAGKIKEAGRIFDTVKYGDGLIRIGNYYYKRKETLYALSFFQKAGYQKGIRLITKEMVKVFKTWLKEEE